MLRNNIIVLTLSQLNRILLPQEKRRGIRIAILSLVNVLVEVLGLAMMIPVMLAATDQEFVTNNSTMRWVYEKGGFQSYENFMIGLALCLVLVFLLKNLFGLLVSYLQSRFAYDVSTSLSRRQLLKYYARGYTYFTETNSADIVQNVQNIPSYFSSNVLLATINFLSELGVMATIVLGIASYDFTLFLSLLVILVPSAALIYRSTKNKLYELGNERKRLAMINLAELQKAIFGYVDVQMNNKQAYFIEKYIHMQHTLNTNIQVRYIYSLIPTRALELIAVLGILVIFLYAFLIQGNSGQIFGFVAVFATASFRVLPSMNRLLGAMMSIKSHQFTSEELLDGDLVTELDMGPVIPVPFQQDIALRDVSFQYPGAAGPALNKVSLTIRKGERIGLVGESGSGKTTLANLILRFLEESEGSIYIDGERLTSDHTLGWRQQVGYVQQHNYLIDGSLRENIAFGENVDEIDEEALERAVRESSLWEFVQTLPDGLETPVGEMGARLSGGQRQRIGIARALYWKSTVLVLDEATSALDTETENAITESIQQMDDDITIIVIAHRFTTLRYCDRIFEMSNGRISGIYTYSDLLEKHTNL